MFLAASNRKPGQKLFKLWRVFGVLLLAFYIIGLAEVRQLTQWSNNILKDPGSFCLSALPFLDCCWLVLSGSSIAATATHHLLTQLFHKAEEDPVPHL